MMGRQDQQETSRGRSLACGSGAGRSPVKPKKMSETQNCGGCRVSALSVMDEEAERTQDPPRPDAVLAGLHDSGRSRD